MIKPFNFEDKISYLKQFLKISLDQGFDPGVQIFSCYIS